MKIILLVLLSTTFLSGCAALQIAAQTLGAGTERGLQAEQASSPERIDVTMHNN